MAIQTRAQLKQWFRRGAYPTAAQFADAIDSFIHKLEGIEMQSVAGLATALNGKYDASEAKILEATVKGYDATLTQLRDDMADLTDMVEAVERALSESSYTLDYHETATVMQEVNMESSEVEVIEIKTFNVAKLYVTTGEHVRKEVDPENIGELKIGAGAVATWEIERATADMAAVGIKYRRELELDNDYGIEPATD